MKKIIPIAVILLLAVVVTVVKLNQKGADAEPLAWYGMAPHPYITEVRAGVEACGRDFDVPIRIMVGQEWTQDNENTTSRPSRRRGTRASASSRATPPVPTACSSCSRTTGQIVVAYGAEPNLPTPAPSPWPPTSRGGDDACEELVKMMGGKGNILNVLETVTDVNTKKRDDAINGVVATSIRT